MKLKPADYLKLAGFLVTFLLAARYVGKREQAQDELATRVLSLEGKLTTTINLQTERDRLILDRLADLRVDVAALKAEVRRRGRER